ncbi:MAG: D-Ala-D-Ala carboxypeptidase family metallohydrolase [Rhizobiaceae bacterium]
MTGPGRKQIGRTVLRQRHVGQFGWMSVICAGLLLASCTAANQSGPPSLANVLTADGQQEGQSTVAATSQPSDDQTTPPAAAAATATATTAATTVADSQRPSGVPRLRPGSRPGTPAEKNALVANQNPQPVAQKAAEELAQGSASPDAAPAKRRQKGFFTNLFQSNPTSRSREATNTTRTGVVRIRNRKTLRARLGWNTSNLPGVRKKKDIYGVGGVDEGHELDDGLQLASVTNRARLGSHGLLLQRPDVKVHCFPPKLVRLLRQIERRFGRAPIITSGYRSRAYNRRIRGARNSMHIQCKAADIQVKGVSKRRLARYVRSLPGRGGVGTYCNSKSIHVDVGRKRDWNRRCRRSRRRKS